MAVRYARLTTTQKRRSHLEAQPGSQWIRRSTLVAIAVAALGTPANVTAQALKDVKAPDKPLVLKAQGSFF